MKYWTQQASGEWVQFTDHQDHHRKALLSKEVFVTHDRPIQTLKTDEIDQIMKNQSWEGIKK